MAIFSGFLVLFLLVQAGVQLASADGPFDNAFFYDFRLILFIMRKRKMDRPEQGYVAFNFRQNITKRLKEMEARMMSLVRETARNAPEKMPYLRAQSGDKNATKAFHKSMSLMLLNGVLWLNKACHRYLEQHPKRQIGPAGEWDSLRRKKRKRICTRWCSQPHTHTNEGERQKVKLESSFHQHVDSVV